jgi:hypothetical protein
VEITASLTRQFWRAMNERFGTRVVPKRSSAFMAMVGVGLDVIGVMDRQTFLSRYTTVVGRRIYPWFELGEGDERRRWYQIVVCVHEHQHVVQARRDGLSGFTLPYLYSSRRRALIEAEAYSCNLEMNWWRDRQMPEPCELAGRLSEYGCKEADVAAAGDFLEAAAQRIRDGEVVNEASRFAIDWLERYEH